MSGNPPATAHAGAQAALAPGHAAAHQALHEGLHQSHAALQQIRTLETELSVRKGILKIALASDLQQRAGTSQLAATKEDIAKLVEDIVG